MDGWWVADTWQKSPVLTIAWAAWVIVSITLHELAHGWAAIRRGDRTPIELGRMTFNPIVHMGTMSLIAFAVIGIAWGSMPVNPSRLRGRYAEAFVAAAGPAVNLVLAIGCILLLAAWELVTNSNAGASIPPHIGANLATVFWAGALLNIVLLMFNLIPVPPLDGSRILADFVPSYGRMFDGPQGQYVGLGLFMLMFFFGFDVMWSASAWVVNSAVAVLLLPFA